MLPVAPIMAAAAGPLAEAAATAFAQGPRVAQSLEAAGDSFMQVLGQFAGGAVDSLKHGEAAAISGVEGKIPVQKVVEAVMSAERDLHTVVALRDKAVGAYQEISRMAI